MLRHVKTVHGEAKPFQCPECDSRFTRSDNLISHIKRVHEVEPRSKCSQPRHEGETQRRPYACPDCRAAFTNTKDLRKHADQHTRTEGLECPVCHVRILNIYGLNEHIRHRHPESGTAAGKRKSSTKIIVAEPSTKRIKDEPSLDDNGAKGAERTEEFSVPQAHHFDENGQQPLAVDIVSVKAEQDPIPNPSPPVLRLRATVHLKTSSGRVLTFEDQPVSMNFGEFRKLVGIPPNTPKRFVFKKAARDAAIADQWVVAANDSMMLPLVDGCIVAETCENFVDF